MNYYWRNLLTRCYFILITLLCLWKVTGYLLICVWKNDFWFFYFYIKKECFILTDGGEKCNRCINNLLCLLFAGSADRCLTWVMMYQLMSQWCRNSWLWWSKRICRVDCYAGIADRFIFSFLYFSQYHIYFY